MLVSLLMDSQECFDQLIAYHTGVEFDHASEMRCAGVNRDDLCPLSDEQSRRFVLAEAGELLDGIKADLAEQLKGRLFSYSLRMDR